MQEKIQVQIAGKSSTELFDKWNNGNKQNVLRLDVKIAPQQLLRYQL